jgi:hypothetical protein
MWIDSTGLVKVAMLAERGPISNAASASLANQPQCESFIERRERTRDAR